MHGQVEGKDGLRHAQWRLAQELRAGKPARRRQRRPLQAHAIIAHALRTDRSSIEKTRQTPAAVSMAAATE